MYVCVCVCMCVRKFFFKQETNTSSDEYKCGAEYIV